ncbi:MAG: hypothetical protein MUE30_10850, partial [Spirosomaceae bacterium]|nr:hypothetical protein [Spirosomataceae bacterium]
LLDQVTIPSQPVAFNTTGWPEQVICFWLLMTGAGQLEGIWLQRGAMPTTIDPNKIFANKRIFCRDFMGKKAIARVSVLVKIAT